jgi:putative peptidoglycan lipid II flippase
MDEPTLDPVNTEDVPGARPEPPGGGGISTTRALATAGLIVTVASLASRILGFVRYIAIVRAVPDAASLDAFNTAFRIPDFLFQLVAAGALASALVPVIAGLFATGETPRAWRVVSTLTTLILGALALLVVIAEAAAPQLVAFIAPGFSGAKLQMTTDLTRVMLLSPLFMAGGAIASAALNARGRFAAASVAPLVYNLGIIGGALFAVPALGVTGLAVGVVAGAAGHVLVQVPGMLAIGARLRPSVDLRDGPTRRALVLMGPRTIGLGATQIVFLVVTALATSLPDGSVTAFNLAFALLQIPIGVIGVPLGTVLLPSLSRVAATGDTVAFHRLLVRGLSLLAYVMLAISCLGIPVAGDVVREAYGLGHLDPTIMAWVAASLAVFMIGLTAHSLIAVLARAFYALQDTATPLVAAIVAVGVNIVVGVLLVAPLGLAGLAVAIAAGAWIEAAMLVLLLGRRLSGHSLRDVWLGMAKSTIAAVPGALAAWAVTTLLVAAWGSNAGFAVTLVRLCAATAAGGAVMLAASLGLRIEEPRRILGIVLDLTRRRGR